MSKVYEKDTMEPQSVESDLECIKNVGEWSCAPQYVYEPIEEDGLFWVNYDCNTLGWHTFGPYRTIEEAKIIEKALKEAWPEYLSRMWSS